MEQEIGFKINILSFFSQADFVRMRVFQHTGIAETADNRKKFIPGRRICVHADQNVRTEGRKQAMKKIFNALKFVCILSVLVLSIGMISFASEDAAEDQLLVGAAIRDITPTNENGLLPVPGIGREAGDLVDVINPIHTRVIALQLGDTQALIICTETGKGPLGDQFCSYISEHTGVPVEAIFYTTTHSHAAPELVFGEVSLEEQEDEENITKWARYTLNMMLDAADEALANLQPATVSIGYGESYVNINRTFTYTPEDGEPYNELGYNMAGDVDPTLAVIRFDDEDGEPIAFVINYACHGVTMIANTYFDGETGIDPDFCGQVSVLLEDQYDGAVAMWTSGAAGDLNPFISNQIMYPDPDTGDLVTVYSGETMIRDEVAYIHYDDIKKVLADAMEPVDVDILAYAEDYTDLPGEEGSEDVTLSLQLLRIGDIAFIGSPGELFHSIGEYIRDNSPLPYTIVVDNTWNWPDSQLFYIPDDEGIINPGFAGTLGYAVGTVNPYLSDLANALIAETEE